MKEIGRTRIGAVAVTKVVSEPATDFTGNKLSVTISLLDSKANEGLSVTKLEGVWSAKTAKLIADLYESVEEDTVAYLQGDERKEEKVDDQTGLKGGLFG